MLISPRAPFERYKHSMYKIHRYSFGWGEAQREWNYPNFVVKFRAGWKVTGRRGPLIPKWMSQWCQGGGKMGNCQKHSVSFGQEGT